MDANVVAIVLHCLNEPGTAGLGFRASTIVAGFGKNDYIMV